MSNGYSAHTMIKVSDESVELYHMEDVQWVEWVMLGWIAVGTAIAIWYLTVIVKRQRNWLIFTLLGVASVGLVAGGFFVQMGWHGPYIDDEGMWACPSGLNAMRITEANGYPLSDGIVQCRADAKKNVAMGGAMAGAGVALTVGSGVFLRRLAPRKNEMVDI